MSMIRVIGGKYKGKRLKRVPSRDVRPMPNKLKESLFNIIQHEVADSIFLDGFAGTGSIGIEALSRGAKKVYFIDNYFPSIKIIKANLVKCQVENNFDVIHSEFNLAIIRLAQKEIRFNLIFLDPPYRLLDQRNPLKVIYKRKILEDKGIVILRHHAKTKFATKYFQVERKALIGDDVLAFFSLAL